MDDLIAELKRLYIEQLTNTLAPHKVLIFIFDLLGIIELQNNQKTSIVLGILHAEVVRIFDIESGPLSKALIMDLLLSIGLAILTLFFYKILRNFFFGRLSQQNRFGEYAKRLTENAKREMNPEKIVNLLIVKDLEKEIKKKKAAIIQMHSWGEVFMAFTWISFLGLVFRKDLFDFISCLVTLLVILWLQRRSFFYYIKSLVPLITTEKAFLDQEFKFEETL